MLLNTVGISRLQAGEDVKKQSRDHGADVVLMDVPGGRNLVIQCKTSKNAFGADTAAAYVHSAADEYGNRSRHAFQAVLAVNAPSVRRNVSERAKLLGVEIWDRPVLEKLLNKHRVLYRELDDLLADPRLMRAAA